MRSAGVAEIFRWQPGNVCGFAAEWLTWLARASA